MRRAVVCTALGISDGVRELLLDDVWPELELLIQDRPGHRTEAVTDDFILAVTHASQCRVDRVLAHRTAVGSSTGKNIATATGDGVQFGKNHDRLLRKRHQMVLRVLLAGFHALGRNCPQCAVQIDFGPLGLAQFARADEQEWRQLKRRLAYRR